MLQWLSDWSEKKTSWAVLFISALSLQITALVFQHVQGLQPCVMCIYQRTAMYGILLAGLLVLSINNVITRVIALLLWAVSAGWGFLIAREHLDILNAANPFFVSCEIVPNFPSWAPLHEWLPAIFAAKGLCNDDSWQFLSLNMPQWMSIIFAVYFLVFVAVLASRFVARKPF